MSALNSLGIPSEDELSSQIKEKRDEAFKSYKDAKQSRDREAAQAEWSRYGDLDDASIRLDRAIETAKALLGPES